MTEPDRTKQSVENLTRAIQQAEIEQEHLRPRDQATLVHPVEESTFVPEKSPELLNRLHPKPARPRRPIKIIYKPPVLHRIKSRYEAHLVMALEPLNKAIEQYVLSEYEGWVDSARERLPTFKQDAPTEAQIKAGNYPMQHIRMHGFEISIENKKGTIRSGKSKEGKKWSVKMAHDYGYIRRTEGADGDHLDVFIGPYPKSEKIFVIYQVDPSTKRFDEHKVMFGFDSQTKAKVGYLANYEKGWKGIGKIKELTVDEFKDWLDDADLRIDAHVKRPGSRGGHIIGYRHGEPIYAGKHHVSAIQGYTAKGGSLESKFPFSPKHRESLTSLVKASRQKHPELIHRGMSFSKREWDSVWKKYTTEGQVHQETGFDSFTKERSRTAAYGGGEIKVLLHLKSKHHANIEKHSIYPEEDESLTHDLKWKVKKAEWGLGGILHVYGTTLNSDKQDSFRSDDEYEVISALFGRIRMGLLERETPITSSARYAAQLAAAAVSGRNLESIKPVLERVLKVDPFQSEPWLLPEARNWITENVSLIKSVASSHLDDVEKLIYRMVREGKPIKEVREELADRFGVSKSRARLIARDQVNKYNGRLTKVRQQNVGIKEYKWFNVQDVRVRGEPAKSSGGKYPKAVPAHTIMHEVRCRWDNPNVYHNGKRWVPRTGKMPKAHPGEEIQCILGTSYVNVFNPVYRTFRNWFAGETSFLILESGKTFECTPNHPILTLDGWKPANLIEKGDYLIQICSDRRFFFDGNEHTANATAMEIFDSFLQTGMTQQVSGSRNQFHGDGSDKNVDIVGADRSLWDALDSMLDEQTCKHFLTDADVMLRGMQFLGASDFSRVFSASLLAPDSVVSVLGKLQALFACQAPHTQEIRLAAIARLDSLFDKSYANSGSSDFEFFRKREFADALFVQGSNQLAIYLFAIGRVASRSSFSNLNTLSSEVLAQIVGVDVKLLSNFSERVPFQIQMRRVLEQRRREFSGHVFNLETGCGWYTADNYIVQNCRCIALPVLPDWMVQ